MATPHTEAFDTRAEFQRQWRILLARSVATLDLFDPDCALFQLGARDVDAALRRLLHGGGMLRLVLHTPAHVERHDPRFLRLLLDYGHRVECRQTPRGLRQLTDSFALADGAHALRRFHSDHFRGDVNLDTPSSVDTLRERFSAIWTESRPGLQETVAGL